MSRSKSLDSIKTSESSLGSRTSLHESTAKNMSTSKSGSLNSQSGISYSSDDCSKTGCFGCTMHTKCYIHKKNKDKK